MSRWRPEELEYINPCLVAYTGHLRCPEPIEPRTWVRINLRFIDSSVVVLPGWRFIIS